MKILFVTQAYPNPTGAGWERRAAQHIRALKRLGEVTVVLPWRPEALFDQRAAERCRHLGAANVLIRDHPPLSERISHAHASTEGRLKRAFYALRRPSYLDARAERPHVAHYRDKLANRFDVAFAFKIQSAIWLESILTPSELPTTAIVDFDDLESTMFKKAILDIGGHTPFWAWKLERQYRWLIKTEVRLASTWTAACFASPADAKRFESITPGTLWTIPNAYEFEPVSREQLRQPINALFVGTFGYKPNVRGVHWFVNEVWPILRSRLGEGITLTLAGFTPPMSITELTGTNGIAVIPDAPDITPLYDAANIIIAPLLEGSGTRIKLIEAAARGRAIVTTSVGCEGLGFEDREHAEIADSPIEFARRIEALALDPKHRSALSKSAYDHAFLKFDRHRVEDELARAVADVIGSSHASR